MRDQSVLSGYVKARKREGRVYELLSFITQSCYGDLRLFVSTVPVKVMQAINITALLVLKSFAEKYARKDEKIYA